MAAEAVKGVEGHAEPKAREETAVRPRAPKEAERVLAEHMEEAERFPMSMLPTVVGREVVEELGIVVGADVRNRTLLHDVVAAIGGMFGGESHIYSNLVDRNRKAARARLLEQARALGATSVVSVREVHATTVNRIVVGVHSACVVYGTAVRCRPAPRERAKEGARAAVDGMDGLLQRRDDEEDAAAADPEAAAAKSEPQEPARPLAERVPSIVEAKEAAAKSAVTLETVSAAVASGVSPLSSKYADINARRFRMSTRPEIHGRASLYDIGDVAAADVRSKNFLKSLWTAVGGVVGGEAPYATHLLNEAMAAAADKAVARCKEQAADGIVKCRFELSLAQNRLIAGLHASVVCYGTAVRLRKQDPSTASDEWR